MSKGREAGEGVPCLALWSPLAQPQGAPQEMGSPPTLPGLPSAPTWQGGHPLGLLVTLAPAGGAQGGGQRRWHQCLWWGL